MHLRGHHSTDGLQPISPDSLTDWQVGPIAPALPPPTAVRDEAALRREIWIVTNTKELRHVLSDAALHFDIAVNALDWREADHRLGVEGVPGAVVVTDWDLRINPTACRAFLARGAQVLILRGMTIEGLDLDVVEHPSVDVLPLTFDLEAFGQALSRLDGARRQQKPTAASAPAPGRPEPATISRA